MPRTHRLATLTESWDSASTGRRGLPPASALGWQRGREGPFLWEGMARGLVGTPRGARLHPGLGLGPGLRPHNLLSSHGPWAGTGSDLRVSKSLSGGQPAGRPVPRTRNSHQHSAGRSPFSQGPGRALHPAHTGPPMAALAALGPGVPPTLPGAQGRAQGREAYLCQARLPSTRSRPGTRSASSSTFIFDFPVRTEELREAVPGRFWHGPSLSACPH